MEARGQNGTITFDGAVVTVTRHGFTPLAAVRAGKRIPVGDIAEVELRPAGALVSGFLAIRPVGGGGRARGAEDAIVFNRRQEPQFAALRQAVVGHRADGGRTAIDDGGTVAEGGETVADGGGTVADELTKLAKLVELELLTREEFDEQKAKLLRG
ncbi:SHOCT domain-containing protein [Actinoplanes sp. NBRC 103695]|uniref:SHOCT domain-containing protein n=1 Tax=Actinoplanes sp. NBRC 103695 TaxID=3032202 RepID=UPI00255407FC|nr:SHOCT domain-containing protein [Actinoplanes sp. NBRC 103695]GLY99325.1 hypothetical protein Acsp02_65780 [Actinoplanes sp. NBRC 103695]